MTASSQEVPTGTKTKIMNAAEKLFGQHGFDATSLRDITAEAGVNLAAVNYHFQSKESLIDALIERRLGPIKQKRLQMLEAAGPAPALEQIVEAFLAPILDHDLPTAVPLIGRVLSNPSLFLERVYKPHLGETVARFSEALGKALPGLSTEERFWRVHFMAGAMTHILALSGVLPLMEGSGGTLDRATLMARMVTFLVAGFRASADSPDNLEKG